MPVLDTKRRHGLYEAWEQQTRFLWASYRGGKDYIAIGALDKYPRELDVFYQARAERTYYFNLFSAVIDAYVSEVYKKDPVREPGDVDEQPSLLDGADLPEGVGAQETQVELSPAMNDFQENATGGGQSLTRFVREQATFALATERAYVMVDVARNGMPYVHAVHPDNLLDFAKDEDGSFLWALIAEKYVEESDPFADRTEETRFRLWTPVEWTLYDENAAVVDTGRNDAGRVPLVEIPGEEVSLPVYDIALLVKRIYNLGSQLDEILVNQTFSQMYVQSDGVENRAGEEVVSEAGDTRALDYTVGTGTVLDVPMEAKMAPGFIAPSDGPANTHILERDKLEAAVFRMAGLERRDPDAIAPQSGVAKAYDFRETNSRLVSLAQLAERTEEAIFSLVNAYGVAGEVNVSYSKDFNVENFVELLDSHIKIQDAALPVEAKRRSAMNVAMAIAEEATEDEKRQIREAVENMTEADFGGEGPSPLAGLLNSPPFGVVARDGEAT